MPLSNVLSALSFYSASNTWATDPGRPLSYATHLQNSVTTALTSLYSSSPVASAFLDDLIAQPHLGGLLRVGQSSSNIPAFAIPPPMRSTSPAMSLPMT